MGLQNTRTSNYADWYLNVVKAADMAENSPARGCMVIKPWGYGIWENIKSSLDEMIKETGHENCYFPLFIPLSLFQKEADHVDGFAKEMAVVTHSRLENKDGKLTPASPLEEPLVVRPTSETIIAESFAKWVGSYRDLPIMINQWANVVRWEMRTRMFLRTAEFLWQEGHTAHSTEEEAVDETLTMIECYRKLAEDYMAMPVIVGRKTELDKFPGAVDTYGIIAMMPDGRALQAGTSHYLGQNFAKSANISFQNKDNKPEFAYTTSWGVSTRLIGGLIMTHGDDEGLKVPPRIAPYQVVIVPIYRNDDTTSRDEVNEYAENLEKELKKSMPFGEKIRVKFDKRDRTPVDKRWEWLRKGAPIVVEVGPKDIEKNSVAVVYRNRMEDKKQFIDFNEFTATTKAKLEEIQTEMFENAKKLRDESIIEIDNWDDLVAHFKPKNKFLEAEGKSPAFVKIKWCGCNEQELEDKLKEFQAAIHCITNEEAKGKCVVSGEDNARYEVLVARSY